MSPDYAEHLYLERDVDRRLWEITRKWLGSSQILWASLETAPGMGNSWLLKHLQNLVRKHETAFGDIAVIFVKSSPYEANHGLGPLGQELYDRYTLSRVKSWKRVKRVLREVGPINALGLGLLAIAALLVVFLLKGLSEYIKLKDWRELPLESLWNGFAHDFLPHHWHEFPIWFLTDWSVSVPLTIAVAAYSYWRGKRKKKTAAADDEESSYFKSRAELAVELTEICWRARGVILLIDDAHRLRNDEKQVLIDLVNPVAGSALQDFTSKHRVLIVTVESEYISWEGRTAQATLKVPTFSQLELTEIADRQLTTENDEDARTHRDELAKQAQENIKLLFAHREQQLIDELGKQFSALKGKGFDVTFNVAELMAYVSVLGMRTLQSREFVEALESSAATLHFARFGYRPVADSARLLDELRNTSTLVQQVHERTFYFDVRRCRALRVRLRNIDRQLLAEAHLFWFSHFRFRALQDRKRLKHDEVRDLSSSQQVNLKSAAWHAAQIGVLLDRAPEVLSRASNLKEEDRGELACDIASLMLGAATVYADEGNLTEANDLVADALEWLSNYKHAEQSELVHAAVALLWRHYWLSGNSLTRERLNEIAREFPNLSTSITKSISDRVNRRFEEMLQSQEKLSPNLAKARITDPVLTNLNRLTDTFWRIRQTQGLVEVALEDRTLEIPDPVVAAEFNTAEFELRQLQLAAWSRRGIIDRLGQGLADWRQRLKDTKPVEGILGREVTYLLQTARYWHTLADIYQDESKRADELEDGRDECLENLQTLIVDACLNPPSDEASLQLEEFIWRNARSAYERALQIAALLDWRIPLLEASFHFGILLKKHTPPNEQNELPPWWQRWDEQLFHRAIELEKDLQWVFHTPEIHLIRWEFFAEKDHEHSVEDAFNAYQYGKRAHYPIKLVLRWHQQVSSSLTNFGDSDIDRRRCAELHEEWAHDLAPLDEAKKHAIFKRLEYEQANSLHFAAQARRILKEFEACEHLLDEADELVLKAQQDEPESEEPQRVRDLRHGLKLQRAWMFNGQSRKDEYKAATFELWSDLRIQDESCAIVLGSLLNIERAMKLLEKPWPAEEVAPHIDPANANLSLPVTWFIGSSRIQLRNRFEFRFFQLLNLINFVARGVRPQLNVAPDPERVFSTFSLHSAAVFHWFDCNNYGEVVLQFGRIGMEFISGETQAKEFLIKLLDAVQFYFSQVQQVDRDELEALQLLMHYEPLEHHRVRYVQVLTESKYLLERELLAREAADEPNWLAIANKVNSYLGILVDATVQSNWINMGLQQTGMSASEFLALKNERVTALVEAKAKYNAGELVGCRQTLSKVLPPERNPWVFLEDLQIIDLWLRCAIAQGLSSHANGDLNKYTTALRKGTEQFIRQFGLSIREIEGQRLATQLLDSIQGRTSFRRAAGAKV